MDRTLAIITTIAIVVLLAALAATTAGAAIPDRVAIAALIVGGVGFLATQVRMVRA